MGRRGSRSGFGPGLCNAFLPLTSIAFCAFDNGRNISLPARALSACLA